MFCKLICLKRSPLYNGCGHPLDSQNAQFDYIFYLFITVHKLDYDQIKDKIQDVCSKVDGKMNARKSSNQLTFSWQSNGGPTSVERTQYPVELKGNLYIYI